MDFEASGRGDRATELADFVEHVTVWAHAGIPPGAHRVVPAGERRSGLRASVRPGGVQHQPPRAGCAAAGNCRTVTGKDRPDAAVRRCAGRVRRPGVGGRRERLRPRRGLCRSCRATHILLPSWAAPRPADAIGVIAQAAVLSALHGTGCARLGAQLGVPAGTVRGWLRRLHARAGQLLQEATASFGFLVAAIDTPKAAMPARRGRPGRCWATRWPPSRRARTPRSGGTATRTRTWMR